MSSNSWIIPVSIVSGLILVGLGYNMYSNNKESLAATKQYNDFMDQDARDSIITGGKSKRRKHRKNASKKRR